MPEEAAHTTPAPPAQAEKIGDSPDKTRPEELANQSSSIMAGSLSPPSDLTVFTNSTYLWVQTQLQLRLLFQYLPTSGSWRESYH